MGFEIPNTEPATLRVGDTWKWTKDLPDFLPADTWALKYALTLQTTTSALIQITTTDNGDGTHLASVVKTTTNGYTAGAYSWHSFVTKGSDRHTIEQGQITLLRDLDAGAVDDRSHVKATLDAIQATLLGKASRDQITYSLGGVSLSRMTPVDLHEWESIYLRKYRDELANEAGARGQSTGNRVKGKF